MAKNKTATYQNGKKKKKKIVYGFGDSLKTLFKSLLSNQAAIDSRHAPFYWHIIIFLMALVITWIPTLSKGYTSDHAAIFTAAGNGEVDKGFKELLKKDYFQKYITISQDKTKLVYHTEELDQVSNSAQGAIDDEYNGQNDAMLAKATFVDSLSYTTEQTEEDKKKTGQIYTDAISPYIGSEKGSQPTNRTVPFYYDVFHVESKDIIDDGFASADSAKTSAKTTSTGGSDGNGFTTYLQVYYLPTVRQDDSDYNNLLFNFEMAIILRANAEAKPTRIPHSFALFTQDNLFLFCFPVNSGISSSALGSFNGNIKAGLQADKSLVVENDNSLSFYNYLSDNGQKNLGDTYESLHQFMNDATFATAIKQVWMQVLYISATYVGTVIIGALLMLFFHKRKTSIDRDVNYFDTFKETVAISFTPALLGLFGFMNVTFAYMLIAGGTLIRVVFSMYKLTPAQSQQDNKPLYQARS